MEHACSGWVDDGDRHDMQKHAFLKESSLFCIVLWHGMQAWFILSYLPQCW